MKLKPYLDYYKRGVEKVIFAIVPKASRVSLLRKRGVKIGKNCHIANISVSTESYLIEIGDHVAIASHTQLITHDGGVWVFRGEFPKVDLFGKIKIGSNTFIGVSCIILPNTTIGENCVIGAGSVVRGKIPDNSIVIGNPGKVIMNTNVYKRMVLSHRWKLDTLGLTPEEKKERILSFFEVPAV